jgi:hypothetical protein
MDIARKIVAGEKVPKNVYIKETVYDEYSNLGTVANRGY